MHILLVEDNLDLGEAIEARLSQLGHSVIWLQDGDEVIPTTRHHVFDALVLDLMLPNKSGFEIIRILRNSQFTTPIVVITARSEIDDKLSLFDMGADDYLVKPFDFRELEARLRAAIRRVNGLSSNIVTIGNTVIDMAGHRLIVAGEEMEYNRREFSLLEILLNNLGKTVSKDMLMERLFNLDDDVSFNALEVYISRLRRKLSTSDIEIQTLRGIGYKANARND